MDGQLVFARMYYDNTMEDVRADEAGLSEAELEKRFSDSIELLKYKAILNGELVPDMEKTAGTSLCCGKPPSSTFRSSQIP